jgi:prepilin-type N-terminal cleavage/methylation domain-containing protein
MPFMRRAFTLIELLVVIAIIAILAAILFPVFAQAKLAAKKSRAMAQMKQLGTGVFLYAGDYDDYFVPASNRATASDPAPAVWPPLVNVYIKNKEIFLSVDNSGATFADDWATRKNQDIGLSDATGVILDSTTPPGAAPQGTEGFGSAANFSQAEEVASTGLFANTPNGSNTAAGIKERGYVFNPYNGADSPDGDYKKGLPLIADVDLCIKIAPDGTDYTGRGAGALKPIFARYGANGKNDGMTPVIFADSHAKLFSAKYLNGFGKVVWRFR